MHDIYILYVCVLLRLRRHYSTNRVPKKQIAPYEQWIALNDTSSAKTQTRPLIWKPLKDLQIGYEFERFDHDGNGGLYT